MHVDAGKGHGCGCSHSHPIEELGREHRTIEAVLDAMERRRPALRTGAVDRAFWTDALDFLEHYADRCHHGKEEALLFVELERAGLPAAHGPTACMRDEHETGRRHRRAMVAALLAGDGRTLDAAIGDYATLMRAHIQKEDHVLFPMAKDMLDHAAVQRLRKGFANVEHHEMGEGTHCRYEELARSLVAAAAT